MGLAHPNHVYGQAYEKGKKYDKGDQGIYFNPCDGLHMMFDEFQHDFLLLIIEKLRLY